MKKILSLFMSFIALSSIMIGSETKAAAAAAAAPLLEDMALTVPMALIRPGQVRHSPVLAAAKEVEIVNIGGNRVYVPSKDEEKKIDYKLTVIPVWNNARTAISCFDLLDGHHHAIRAIGGGATHAVVLIEEDKKMSIAERDALRVAQSAAFPRVKEGKIQLDYYLIDNGGVWAAAQPATINNIIGGAAQPDPIREWLWGKKETHKYDKDGTYTRKVAREGDPVWIKITGKKKGVLKGKKIKTPNYAEFIIADILRAYGFNNAEAVNGNEIIAIEHLRAAKDFIRDRRLAPPIAPVHPRFPFGPAPAGEITVAWGGFNLVWLELPEA